MTQGITKIEHLLDPEVLTDMLQAEVGKAIRFAPLADVDDTLQGQPGTTITVPKWDYIGDAEDVAEGEAIPMTQLGKTKTTMTIKKAGKGVEITDEAILSGFGDPIGEATRQVVEAIDHKVDNDVITALNTATQTASIPASVKGLSKALDMFNDEDDTPTVLICNPKNASTLRLEAAENWLSKSELGADMIIKGTFGEILGVQVVRSRKCPENTAYLVRPGALRITLKRSVMVETARDIKKALNAIVANKHYGVYLYRAEKVIKVTFTASA